MLACMLTLVVAVQAQIAKPASYHHSFFGKKSFAMGFGAAYSAILDAPGFYSSVYYHISKQIRLGPEVSYVEKAEEGVTNIDFVGHYIFGNQVVGIYPLIGANYTQKNNPREEKRAFGVVYGMGVQRNFKKIQLFIEYSRVASALNDQFLTLGLLYAIQNSKNKRN